MLVALHLCRRSTLSRVVEWRVIVWGEGGDVSWLPRTQPTVASVLRAARLRRMRRSAAAAMAAAAMAASSRRRPRSRRRDRSTKPRGKKNVVVVSGFSDHDGANVGVAAAETNEGKPRKQHLAAARQFLCTKYQVFNKEQRRGREEIRRREEEARAALRARCKCRGSCEDDDGNTDTAGTQSQRTAARGGDVEGLSSPKPMGRTVESGSSGAPTKTRPNVSAAGRRQP